MLGNGDSLYCGGVMNYSARISPTSLTSPQSECSQTSCTFSDLICETTYNITIEATYRETATTASDSTTITTGQLICVSMKYIPESTITNHVRIFLYDLFVVLYLICEKVGL